MPKSATLTRPPLVSSTLRRLDVAVDDAARMRRVERLADLLGDARGRRGRQRPALAEDRGEVAAVDQLHDDERVARVHAVVEDVDDVRMVQRGGGLRLLAEARHEGGVAAVLGAQHLDRDVAAELGVVGPVDGRHAALAEQLDQAVAAAEDVSYLGQGRAAPIAVGPAGARDSAQVEAGRGSRRNSPPMSGRSSASSTDALSQPIVVPAS